VDNIIHERKKANELKQEDGFDETAPTDLLGILLAARNDQGQPVFDDNTLRDHVC
jgi:cytochrome P450